MQEDEQFIKKLMKLLGSGNQIKLKALNGQTIKVSLDGSSYNQTQYSLNKSNTNINNVNSHEEYTQQGQEKNKKQFKDCIQSQQKNEQNQIGLCLSADIQQISNDFNALKIKENNQTVFNDEYLDHLLVQDLQKIEEKQSASSKNQDNIFKQLIGQIQQSNPQPFSIIQNPIIPQNKQKKISLSSKNKKISNENVTDFFTQQTDKNKPDKSFQETIPFPAIVCSSPIISRVRQNVWNSTLKSQSVKQSMNQLRERHPSEQKTIQLINERLQQLQQKQKIAQHSLSLLNSSLSNTHLDSFNSLNMSLLSLNKNQQDPLCYILAKFLSRAKDEIQANKSKAIASSFLFMFSQPLIDTKGRQIQQQINYFQQQQIIQKILRDSKCKIDYVHQPATIAKFFYWINQGAQILHFCGHGVKTTQSYLIFEKQNGIAENVTVTRLTQLLNGSNTLKLVFVASCHSEQIGRVFDQAGASHVICVKQQYQISDQACLQFVKLFYSTCINSKTTICQSFYFAKKQLQLKGKFTKHQCQKFVLICKHARKSCGQYFEHRNKTQQFNSLNSTPSYCKNLLSRVEDYIPRCKQMQNIIQLIDQRRRYITIVGQSGIGKSTLVRELVRYIQFRNIFKDGVIYLQLSRCQSISKVFQVISLQLFQISQIKLNKSTIQNATRVVKQINNKNILFIFDNCQNIMVSQDRDQFKKFTQILMKNCTQIVFVFTNRHSLGRQIDYCSQSLYQLGKLTESQSKRLFFNKVSRHINKKQLDDFFSLDKGAKQISQHSFFNFLNGHPEAICMTASLLAYRSLKQLYQLLLKPSIGKQMHQSIKSQQISNDSINKVVLTAMRISLNVINHKQKDVSQIIKMLSLLPNGLDNQMMSRLFPQGGKWKQNIKKLISHNLVQCMQKGGIRYYLLHPHIIIEVQKQMSNQQKMKYHERICQQFVKRLQKIYRNVGTLSPMATRQQQLFLIEEDNYKTILLRELSSTGQKYLLKKFYQDIFKTQFERIQDQKQQSNLKLLSNSSLLSNLQKNKRLKTTQTMKNLQKKQEPIDLIIVYYITILFIVKKILNRSLQTYLDICFTIAHKKNKYLVTANLLRLKACIMLVNNQPQAKEFFAAARGQFAHIGCGLGSACCQAALGYIKYGQQQFASAKMNLQNALKYYDQIPHPFGKHYLNRWILGLKQKLNKQQKQLHNHKMQAQKLLKQAKMNLKANNINNVSIIKHKLGTFSFRFTFDNISLFLQASFEIDLKPKFINSASPYSNSFINNKKQKSSQASNLYILNQINEEAPSYNMEKSIPIASIQKKQDTGLHKRKDSSNSLSNIWKYTKSKKSEKPEVFNNRQKQ